uniref:CD83 molecule n=1 Tax=Fundulus heteroclitus TaxID=8078 RepID=A0A3Q2UH63_FUNHE
MWTQYLLRLALLLPLICSAWSAALGAGMVEVSSASAQDATLGCTATRRAGLQYLAVRWYKLESYPSLQRRGLLGRRLPNGNATLYKDVTREVELQGESHDLFLSNVTCSDSGVYLCYLAAPVGQQNQEGKVLLTLTDCPAGPADPPAGPADPPVGATDSPVRPETPLLADTVMVISASVLLLLALIISFMSYRCLKNTIKDRLQTPKKEILLDAPLKPLDKKDLMLIYTLGPKTSTLKHICV